MDTPTVNIPFPLPEALSKRLYALYGTEDQVVAALATCIFRKDALKEVEEMLNRVPAQETAVFTRLATGAAFRRGKEAVTLSVKVGPVKYLDQSLPLAFWSNLLGALAERAQSLSGADVVGALEPLLRGVATPAFLSALLRLKSEPTKAVTEKAPLIKEEVVAPSVEVKAPRAKAQKPAATPTKPSSKATPTTDDARPSHTYTLNTPAGDIEVTFNCTLPGKREEHPARVAAFEAEVIKLKANVKPAVPDGAVLRSHKVVVNAMEPQARRAFEMAIDSLYLGTGVHHTDGLELAQVALKKRRWTEELLGKFEITPSREHLVKKTNTRLRFWRLARLIEVEKTHPELFLDTAGKPTTSDSKNG